MEETNQTGASTGAVAARPTFLTVLCILSFIFGGIAIIIYALGITAIGAASAMASGMADGMSGEAGAAMQQAMAAAGPSVGMLWANVIIGLLTSLIGIYGVVKMWKLQKVGFFLYTGCAVVSIITGFIVSGFSVFMIITVLFIVLYGLNLKHMK